jgi:hypothetical protein
MDVLSDLFVLPKLVGYIQFRPVLLDHKVRCQLLMPRFQDSANLRLVGDWRTLQLGWQPRYMVEPPQNAPHGAVGDPVRQRRQDRLPERLISFKPLALFWWYGIPDFLSLFSTLELYLSN